MPWILAPYFARVESNDGEFRSETHLARASLARAPGGIPPISREQVELAAEFNFSWQTTFC